MKVVRIREDLSLKFPWPRLSLVLRGQQRQATGGVRYRWGRATLSKLCSWSYASVQAWRADRWKSHTCQDTNPAGCNGGCIGLGAWEAPSPEAQRSLVKGTFSSVSRCLRRAHSVNPRPSRATILSTSIQSSDQLLPILARIAQVLS